MARIALSSSYRAIVRKYFPNARIVADCFHVIRTVLRNFLETWKQPEFGDRLYVALYKEQWDHRGVPYEDGDDPKARLWL